MIGENVVIGKSVKIWHPKQVNIYGTKENPCIIGDDVNIGAFVEIGPGVKIGKGSSIGAFSFIPEGVTIEEECFIGPRTTFTNDKYPPSPKDTWKKTIVRRGARIGAGSVILPGVEIGRYALIGAGSVVTKDVSTDIIVKGNPACEDVHYCKEALRDIHCLKRVPDKWDEVGMPAAHSTD